MLPMKARLSAYKNQVVAASKEVRQRFVRTSTPWLFIHETMPYFCQWESRDLAQAILEHKIQASDDPKWQESGAKTRQEYASWSWSGCGMVCTKMVIAHALHKTVPIVTLGKSCLKYGGYKLPLEDHLGLYYEPYCRFLNSEYGLSARVVSGLSTGDIIESVGSGGYVIASVLPEIRYPNTKPKHRSGHLVLVVGYDNAKRTLYIHNPSGTNKANQEFAEVTFRQFERFSSHRGIVIHKQKVW